MYSRHSSDTQPGDDIFSQMFCGQERVNPNVWGKLYATKEKFPYLELSENEYTIGRDQECKIKISSSEVTEGVLQSINKKHCKIVKAAQEVFLEDLSFNGTYVNNEIIGKGQRRILKNNDQISFVSPEFKVYVYVDASDDKRNFPEEVRSRYIISRELAAGSYGKVYLVFEKNSCLRYVMKILHKKKWNVGLYASNPENIMAEMNILRGLKHPCIIEVKNFVDTPGAMYIILEFMEGGELADRIKSSGRLEENEAKLIFYQIVRAVKYLHDHQITHRDLKPENILLSSDERETVVKVSDFGLSKFVNSQSIMKTVCGIPRNVAPEVLETKGLGSYTKQVDIWSLGVILFVCLSGYYPFSEDYKYLPLHKQIMAGSYSFPKKFRQEMSHDAIDLVKRMLTADPEKRISADEILCHRWLQDKWLKERFRELVGDDQMARQHGPCDDGQSPPRKRRKVDGADTARQHRPCDDGQSPPRKRRKIIGPDDSYLTCCDRFSCMSIDT